MPATEEHEETIALPPGIDLDLLRGLDAYGREHVMTTHTSWCDVTGRRSGGAKVTADSLADLPALDRGEAWDEIVLVQARSTGRDAFTLMVVMDVSERFEPSVTITGPDPREVFGMAAEIRRKLAAGTWSTPVALTPPSPSHQPRRWPRWLWEVTDHQVLGGIILAGILLFAAWVAAWVAGWLRWPW